MSPSNKISNRNKRQGAVKETMGSGEKKSPSATRNWRRLPVVDPSTSVNANGSHVFKSVVVDDNSDDNDAVIHGLQDLDVSDEASIEVKSTSTGRYASEAKYKVKKSGQYSPTSGSFVQYGVSSHSDDPFASTYQLSQTYLRQTLSAEVTPTSQRIIDRTQGNWRLTGSGSHNSGSTTEDNQKVEITTDTSDFLTGETFELSNENAQSHYPPSACVFVANLSSSETEEKLLEEVTRVFSVFGPVFVKIRKDDRKMPYAFCQFTDNSHAELAMLEGKGKMILGRPCRTEPARANRTYFMARKYGEMLSMDDGRKILENFGKVSRTWLPDLGQLRLYGFLERGFFVEFLYFDDGQRAQKAIRNEGIYQLDPANNCFGSPIKTSKYQSPTDSQRTKLYLDTYSHDRNSIFVGNMPQHFTELSLRIMFENFGPIVDVIIHQKPSSRTSGQFLYGFVEYKDPVAANQAITSKNNYNVDGHLLRVTHKRSDHRPSQVSRSMNLTPHSSGYQNQSFNQPMEASPLQGQTQAQHGYGYGPNQTFGSALGGYPAPAWPSYAYQYPTPPAYFPSPFNYPTHGSTNPSPYFAPAPYTFDYYGQAYPAAPYYPPYNTQSSMAETVQESQSVEAASVPILTSAVDHDNSSAGGQEIDGQ